MTTIVSGLGGSNTISAASGGKVTPINTLSTAPAQVIGGNPARQSITFMNPGTVTIYVAPAITATGATLTPSLGALGGCFAIVALGMITITGECQTAWQAFSASGVSQPLTVMESNV